MLVLQDTTRCAHPDPPSPRLTTLQESLYLVMEYAPGGDLAALIQELGVLTLVEARRYFAEIVRCTASCMSGRWKEDGWAKGGG